MNEPICHKRPLAAFSVVTHTTEAAMADAPDPYWLLMRDARANELMGQEQLPDNPVGADAYFAKAKRLRESYRSHSQAGSPR